MPANYAACRYSVTVHTDDIAVLHMLRALCQLFESGSYKQIGWGGTGAGEWKSNDNKVTFRFSAPADRDRFLSEANRLLPGHWSEISTSDTDPAAPQR